MHVATPMLPKDTFSRKVRTLSTVIDQPLQWSRATAMPVEDRAKRTRRNNNTPDVSP